MQVTKNAGHVQPPHLAHCAADMFCFRKPAPVLRRREQNANASLDKVLREAPWARALGVHVYHEDGICDVPPRSTEFSPSGSVLRPSAEYPEIMQMGPHCTILGKRLPYVTKGGHPRLPDDDVDAERVSSKFCARDHDLQRCKTKFPWLPS